MPHGGKRKGAGAPRGNLNAFKHGRYSENHKRLIEALIAQPQVRDALLAFDRAQRRKIRRARITARTLFYRLLLQLPPNPDEKINQALQELRKAIASASPSLGARKFAENNGVPRGKQSTPPVPPGPVL